MRASTLDKRLGEAVKPYRFDTIRWELRQLGQLRLPRFRTRAGVASASDTDKVIEYMNLLAEIRRVDFERESAEMQSGLRPPEYESRVRALRAARESLRPAVQRILTQQIRTVLHRNGIYTPLDRYLRIRATFPPINFVLGEPPHVLIVSPRDRIQSMREIMLRQDLNLQTMEAIEAKVDALDVSSLVSNLGGFGGTYPTFVSDEGSLQWTISTATEEWLHQYLAFTPLGFAYLLDLIGLKRDYEIATMNETLVGIVSKEIGQQVMETYYPTYETPRPPSRPVEPGFDFNEAMRNIRLQVDKMLATGEIEQAEQYMEESRQMLASKGYYIRRLNQAYFAFYGCYADLPTSVDPIGQEMREARVRSASLQQFLQDISRMTSHQDLLRYLRPQTSDWKTVQTLPGTLGAVGE